MADLIIDGITVRSHVYDMKTGKTHDFTPADETRIFQTFLSGLTAEEIRALPQVPPTGKPANPDLLVKLTPGKPPDVSIVEKRG